jgi:hypothetical protein
VVVLGWRSLCREHTNHHSHVVVVAVAVAMASWKRGAAAYSTAPALDARMFQDRLQRALEHPLFIVKVNPISDVHREYVVLGTQTKIYHVHIRTELSCDCPDATHNARKVTLCKHVIYTLVKCLGVARDSEMLRRKHCRTGEIRALLSKARTVQRTYLADDRVRAAFDLHCEGKSRTQIESALKGESSSRTQVDASTTQPTGRRSLAKRAREVIDEESECCVCYDTILKSQNLTWCRRECGRNFHHDCLEGWLAYKRKTDEPLSCPNCRSDPWISTDEQLGRLWDCPAGAAGSAAASAAAPSPYLDLGFAMAIERPEAAAPGAAGAAAAPSARPSSTPPVPSASPSADDANAEDDAAASVVAISPPAKRARVSNDARWNVQT